MSFSVPCDTVLICPTRMLCPAQCALGREGFAGAGEQLLPLGNSLCHPEEGKDGDWGSQVIAPEVRGKEDSLRGLEVN